MPDKIKDIYREIKEKLTAEHLKRITVDIINSYKNKNYHRLRIYASIATANSEESNSKTFALLIKQYHPDKLSYILKQVEETYRSKKYDNLIKLKEKYIFEIESSRHVPEYNIEVEEKYTYDSDDFGYGEKTPDEDDGFGETILEFQEENTSFLDAVRKMIFGGLENNFSEADLYKIDGKLDLSDYDINDLSGIENCIYLEELNLSDNGIEKIGKISALSELKSLYISGNQVENIDVLIKLTKLKEVDISFNNICDISALENLPDLEYVNIIGNPVSDYSVIRGLIKRGVIVVFEHANLLFSPE
jgi:hypothetical protein